MICKKSLLALYLRRYSLTNKDHSKYGTSQMATCLIPSHLDLQTQTLLCGLLIRQAVIWLRHDYHAVKCWWDMRYFISNHAKNRGTSVTPPLLITITQESFTVKIIFLSHIKALGVSKPQYRFRSGNSRRIGIRWVSTWEVPFFLWSLRVWLFILRKSAYRDVLHIFLKHTQ